MVIPNIQTLIAAGIAPTQARLFADAMQPACTRFEIKTPARLAAFLAQCSHESAGFTRLEEGLYYSTPERIRQIWPTRVPTMADAVRLCRNPQALANRVYANRLGNGNEASGDGWRYRGRGLIQITGRTNYQATGDALGTPYMMMPDWVAQPLHATLTAAWFWKSQGCNELADASQIDAITRRINGPGMVAAADRRTMFDEAMRAFA